MDAAAYTILYQDETLLVVDKAAGILTLPAPGTSERTLLDELQADGFVVQPIHRLDKDTSGVLMFGLDARRRVDLEKAFRRRDVHKSYLALVQGRLPAGSGTIDLPIRDEGATARISREGKPARTKFARQLDFGGKAALVLAEPETGRHNQVRLHLAHVGCPLIGDEKFGRRSKRDEELPTAARALLHAARLELKHPVTSERLVVACPPPADFAEVQAELTARWPPKAESERGGARGGGSRPRGRTPPGRGSRHRRRR